MPYSLVDESPGRSEGFARHLRNMAASCVHDTSNVMLLGLALQVFFVFFPLWYVCSSFIGYDVFSFGCHSRVQLSQHTSSAVES